MIGIRYEVTYILNHKSNVTKLDALRPVRQLKTIAVFIHREEIWSAENILCARG